MNDTLRLILTIIHVLICLVIIVSVLFQSSKSEGLSSLVSSAAESYFGRNKARGLDAKLAKITAWATGVFLALTFALAIL